ncbi:MAG: hypothetical protein IPK83_10940 [Planctomycetes bacterium]|nr:hypothetical protein [Planctomycetota bacterium]
MGVLGAHFLDSQKGFLCGGMKGLYRTLDGGQHWTTIPLPGFQGDPLYNVTFLDANVGIVCGDSSGSGPDVYRTTNGGTTWTRVTAFPLGGSWYFQKYVSASTGFAGCNGAIVRTTNAGATWELRSGQPDCPVMTGMDFLDANVGFASGGLPSFQVGVFKTTNGGLSWTSACPSPQTTLSTSRQAFCSRPLSMAFRDPTMAATTGMRPVPWFLPEWSTSKRWTRTRQSACRARATSGALTMADTIGIRCGSAKATCPAIGPSSSPRRSWEPWSAAPRRRSSPTTAARRGPVPPWAQTSTPTRSRS